MQVFNQHHLRWFISFVVSSLAFLPLCGLAVSLKPLPIADATLKQIADSHGISADLMKAIAWTESANSAHALNLQTQSPIDAKLRELGTKFKRCSSPKKTRYYYTIFPKSRNEAAIIIQAMKKDCVGYDVGLFQISRGKMIDYKMRSTELLDPVQNANLAAKIIQNCQKQEKSLWRTIECYHHGSAKKDLTKYSGAVYQSYLRLSLL